MSTQARERPWTVEDVESFPDDGQRHELQAGWLLSEPLPSYEHGRLVAAVASLLRDYARPRKLGVVLAGDSGYVLARHPDTLRGPDVSFVSASRGAAVAEPHRVFEGPPDLVVEIQSPSDRPEDVHAKVADYLAAGTRLVWVIDARRRSVAVYRDLLAPRCLGKNDALDGEDVLPGFEVRVEAIFEE